MEGSIVAVHYQGTRIGNSQSFDPEGVITKNFQANNKQKLTLGQVVDLLFSDPNSRKIWDSFPGSAWIIRGEIVSITLFVKDSSSF